MDDKQLRSYKSVFRNVETKWEKASKPGASETQINALRVAGNGLLGTANRFSEKLRSKPIPPEKIDRMWTLFQISYLDPVKNRELLVEAYLHYTFEGAERDRIFSKISPPYKDLKQIEAIINQR